MHPSFNLTLNLSLYLKKIPIHHNFAHPPQPINQITHRRDSIAFYNNGTTDYFQLSENLAIQGVQIHCR